MNPDPLGLKGTWEGLVEFKDMEATRRTQAISQNAQWFEDHSPVAPQFKKAEVKGVTAHVICAAPQFMAMSSGKVNSTELTAALINRSEEHTSELQSRI